ncbi:PD-(D/E)XK nuclease family protein [Deferribacterales bacterium Es71-Z0220]|uniref:PD-(D/E)XK nuclease family protein n=1 Tax=Deferrivibrio essentukiensis TaxID=2880922 RepID=UPI001F61F02D|nr:PD-(D/E)XK nuclease family protein [Deferrivibrio essentukiensis]MCB4205515.1 PD-(D/E)XK nuclease family protein [Deferrivibrio essentukiensis]
MKETIEKLKNSPLFNLSLSSKELFHSNFLYWIGHNYPLEFGTFFSKFLNEQPENLRIKEIFREKENIDLSFNYSNGQEILIENKVKSVPYIGQLAKYSEKHTNRKNYILLSLSEPMFFQSKSKLEVNGVFWHYLNYSDLQLMLQSLSESINNEYHRQIIIDYCEFISGLIKINEYCKIDREELFDFHSIKTNQLYRELIDIRLHDFYLKKKYELLAYEIYKELDELGKNLTDFSLPLNWNNKKPIIFLGYGMTRSLGLMDLKYLISPNIVLGIQIQGEHYRMVVEDNNSIIAHKIKEKLLDNKLWFDFSNSFPSARVYPKPEKGFNKYGNTFFYKSVKLGTEFTINKIISTIIKDVEHIEKNINEIRTIITQAKNA